MDEWDLGSWCRYAKHYYHWQNRGKQAWGPQARTANQESWRDFAVYYADQWMKRGVGIYYDNTMPQVDRNRFDLREHGVDWQSSIWGHREYFRRVWKRSRELMAKGLTPRDPLYMKSDPERRMRLHIVGHVTNCQVLPFTTWWDATLGVEAPGQWEPEPGLSAEQKQRQVAERGFVILAGPKKGARGHALPYPPDYLRAMECGRMAGLVPHYRHLLRSEDALGGLGISYGATDQGRDEAVRAHRMLSDKAMGLVHEIRGGGNPYSHDGIRTLRAAFDEYGYGDPGVTVHNYWAETPRLKVGNPNVKWIALEKAGSPLLVLLQSYDAEACEAAIDLPAGAAVLDLLSRRLLDPGNPVAFPADYGTRLLLIAKDPAALKPLAWADGVRLQADFGFGLPPGWFSRGARAPRIVADAADPGNRVLRVTPAHPSQHWVQGDIAGDGELSLRFRLPKVEAKPPHPQFYGFLQVLHHVSREWPKSTDGALALGVTPGEDGRAVLAVGYSSRKDGQPVKPKNVRLNRLGEAGALVTLDGAWHRVRLRIEGARRQLWVDDQLLFEGELGPVSTGKLRVGPGWGSWDAGVPYVEIDDLGFRKLKQ
jgi:hypothetical protein